MRKKKKKLQIDFNSLLDSFNMRVQNISEDQVIGEFTMHASLFKDYI